jgi:DNA-directed RNA polymerase subunit RPC12/RpoP
LTISIDNVYFAIDSKMATQIEHATSSLRCPVCRAKVVVALQDEVVIHNAIIKVDFPTRRVTAKCARCKAWVQVPLQYTGDVTPQ